MSNAHNKGRGGDATRVSAHGKMLLYVKILLPCYGVLGGRGHGPSVVFGGGRVVAVVRVRSRRTSELFFDAYRAAWRKTLQIDRFQMQHVSLPRLLVLLLLVVWLAFCLYVWCMFCGYVCERVRGGEEARSLFPRLDFYDFLAPTI